MEFDLEPERKFDSPLEYEENGLKIKLILCTASPRIAIDIWNHYVTLRVFFVDETGIILRDVM